MLDEIKNDRIATEKRLAEEKELERQEKELERQEKELERQEKERVFELERQERERVFELERQEKERVFELERQERERVFELEKHEKELERQESERAFELERRKLEVELERVKQRGDTNKSNNGCYIKSELKNLLPQFRPKEDDVSLFLEMFERQVTFLQIPTENWVAQLIAVIPNEIVQVIARESEEEAKDYKYVKSLLLQRFKMSPEKFRQLFFKHQKKPDATWHDFHYELKTYFEGWLMGLNVETFEQLKDLLIVDQIKKRAPIEFKEKNLENWVIFTNPSNLSEKLEEFEDVRRTIKPKQTNLNLQEKKDYRPGSKPTNESYQYVGKGNYKKFENDTKKEFEERKRLQCYECNSYDHLRPQCPKLKRNNVASINHIRGAADDPLLAPYTTIGKVNGKEMHILRDTGSTIDVISQKYITPDMLTGENVWVRQVFDEELVCLPLAKVEIDYNVGHVITKAAVIQTELDGGRYLLGNQTAALLENLKRNRQMNNEIVNAVQTRAQRKKLQNINHKNVTEMENGKSKSGNIGIISYESVPKKRRKLQLTPKTKPIDPVPLPLEAVSSSSIFGAAKPVDTATREREIEERLLKEKASISKNPRERTDDTVQNFCTISGVRNRSRPSSDFGAPGSFRKELFRDKLIVCKQREEIYRLKREKNQLKLKKKMLERGKAEMMKLEKGKQRMEREQLEVEGEKLRRQAQMGYPSKRPFSRKGVGPPHMRVDKRRKLQHETRLSSSFHREKFASESKFPYHREHLIQEEFRRESNDVPSQHAKYNENQDVGHNPRLMRWSPVLQQWNFEVVHRKGIMHKNADSLSRQL